jgi:hypothetical protein
MTASKRSAWSVPNDTRRTPQWVRAPHILDELPDFFGNDRSARLAALAEPSPVISESFLLPGNDGSRLDDCQSPLPAEPQPGEPHPEPAITWAQMWPRDRLFVDHALVAQSDDFDLHGETRAEAGEDGCEEDSNEGGMSGDLIARGKRIQETSQSQGGFGRDKYQVFQLIRVFRTDRPFSHMSAIL